MNARAMGKSNLYKNERNIETLIARINGKPVSRPKNSAYPMYSEPVSEPNRSKILDFYRSLLTEELSLGRIAVLLGNIYRISIWLEHRPFEELDREDIIALVDKIRNMRTKKYVKRTIKESYSEQTVESYKTTIKKFWRWLKNPGLLPQELQDKEYPQEVQWIKRKKKKNGLLPKDIWTPEEVNIVAGLTTNMRDRAFILGLFGSGCRIGEFLPLERGDVLFDKYSCQIVVDGKTGSRRVRLTSAASLALSSWLDIHPNKSPHAPVWVDIQLRSKIPDRPLSYAWAYKMLKGLAKKAGIDKSIRPHLLRHSLATFYAPKLTESVMNEHFGWQQGGRTASIYTHLSGKQVDDQILAAQGKKHVDPQSNKAFDIVLCPRCGLKNAPCSVQCGKCGFPLTEDAARTLCERRERADEVMNMVTSHPKFKELVSEVLNEKQCREKNSS